MRQSDDDFLKLIDAHVRYASKAESPQQFEKLYRQSLRKKLAILAGVNKTDKANTSSSRILAKGADLLVFTGFTDKKSRKIANACNLRLERIDGAIQLSCARKFPRKYANMVLCAMLLLGIGVASWIWTTTVDDFSTLVPAGYLSGYVLGWIAGKTFDHSYRIDGLILKIEDKLMSSGNLSIVIPT